jgi:hypothetical protein
MQSKTRVIIHELMLGICIFLGSLAVHQLIEIKVNLAEVTQQVIDHNRRLTILEKLFFETRMKKIRAPRGPFQGLTCQKTKT